MVLTLDHVGYVDRSLQRLQDRYTRLGFALTTPRALQTPDAAGGVRDLGQTSCHAVFKTGSLELTAVHAPTPDHHLAPWLHGLPRLAILAFGSSDANESQARAAAQGLAVGAVAEASRRIEYGARRGTARFRWWAVDAADSPEALVCVVQHRDADLVFQPEVQTHPNGAQGLFALEWTLPESRYAAALDVYARLCALAPERQADGSVQFLLQGGRLRLRRGAAFACAVVIGVDDLERARECLQRGAVPHTQTTEELEIGAEAAGGAALRLRVVYPRESQILGK